MEERHKIKSNCRLYTDCWISASLANSSCSFYERVVLQPEHQLVKSIIIMLWLDITVSTVCLFRLPCSRCCKCFSLALIPVHIYDTLYLPSTDRQAGKQVIDRCQQIPVHDKELTLWLRLVPAKENVMIYIYRPFPSNHVAWVQLPASGYDVSTPWLLMRACHLWGDIASLFPPSLFFISPLFRPIHLCTGWLSKYVSNVLLCTEETNDEWI